jgi:hypothetical protein
LSPVTYTLATEHTIAGRKRVLTAINLLRRLLLLLTRPILRGRLRRQSRLRTRVIQITPAVHSFLERVAFPAENIVGVCGRAANVHRVYKRVGAVGRPQGLVGELAHVPHEFVHDLGQLDGVSRGA